MIIERLSGTVKIIAENNKCLVRKGTEQTIEDNEATSIYLAKSLVPSDFEEKDKMKEEDKCSYININDIAVIS